MLEGAPPAPTASKGGGPLGLVMMGSGAFLFLAGYLTPPLVMLGANLPGGTNGLGFVPLVGPLLASQTNPFLQRDAGAVALTVAGTVAQVAGVALAVLGVMSNGSGGSSNARASSLLQGESWALVPTLTPNGVGISLATR